MVPAGDVALLAVGLAVGELEPVLAAAGELLAGRPGSASVPPAADERGVEAVSSMGGGPDELLEAAFVGRCGASGGAEFAGGVWFQPAFAGGACVHEVFVGGAWFQLALAAGSLQPVFAGTLFCAGGGAAKAVGSGGGSESRSLASVGATVLKASATPETALTQGLLFIPADTAPPGN